MPLNNIFGLKVDLQLREPELPFNYENMRSIQQRTIKIQMEKKKKQM